MFRKCFVSVRLVFPKCFISVSSIMHISLMLLHKCLTNFKISETQVHAKCMLTLGTALANHIHTGPKAIHSECRCARRLHGLGAVIT